MNKNLVASITIKEPKGHLLYLVFNSLTYSAIVIFLIQIFRGTNKSETIDKAIVVLSVLFGIYSMLVSMNILKKYSYKITSVIGCIILGIGIYGIEVHAPINNVDLRPILWLGYGPIVLLVTLLIVPFIFSIYSWSGLSGKVKVFLNILAVTAVVLVIPAIWQGGNSIIDNYHAEYVINENLAVSAGYIPYVNFIPQYGTIYSWLLYPFKNTLSADSLVTLSLYMMNIGVILSIAIGVWLVFKAMNKRSLALAVLLVIPFTSAAQFPYRKVYSGTIYSQLSSLPIRLLPGFLIGMLVLGTLSSVNKKSIKNYAILTPFLLGLNLWNTIDFGIALSLSYFCVIIFLVRMRISKLLYILMSFSLGFFTYPVLLTIAGHKINFSWYGIFIRQFGGGFGAEPIITPGPVLIILPWIVALVCASFYLLIKERFSNVAIEEENRRAIITTAFFSLWTLIGFSYYLNRSYASGQMQILFLPLAVASASFFGYLFNKNSELPWKPRLNLKLSTWRILSLKRNSSYLLVAIIMSLPLSSIIAFPNPAIEIDRLTSSSPDHVWPKPSNKKSFSSFGVPSETVSPDSYYGTSANYVKLKYNLNSLSLFNSPFDLALSEEMAKQQCLYLSNLSYKNVILNNEGVAISQAFESKTLCNVFTGDLIANPYFIYRK